jgi:CBS domain-containing protein
MHRAADIMTREVVSVAPETPVSDIAKVLHARHVSGVPVVDSDGDLVGIVSEGDLMKHVGAIGSDPQPRSWWLRLFGDRTSLAEEYAKSHARRARDVMTKNVVTVEENAPLGDVARLLERHRIKRLPVVRDGKLVGIVTRGNLVQVLATSPATAHVSPDDREIQERLSAELAAQPWGTFSNALVQDGIVHLWGLVDSEAERRALRVLAENVPGVKGVEDHLAARPAYGGE